MEVPHEQQPTGGSANACTNACTDDTYSSKSEAVENATHHAHMPAGVPPELQRVIDAWPTLPGPIKAGIKAYGPGSKAAAWCPLIEPQTDTEVGPDAAIEAESDVF